MALALALARCGVRSIIFEQAAGLPPHSRAIIVHIRTLEALLSWNVADRFFEAGEALKHVTAYLAETNKALISFNFELLAGETPHAGPVILPQDLTEKLLYEALLETGLCEVRFQHAVKTMVQATDYVDVTIEPEGGEAYSVRAKYLVGADGAHSAVRANLGLKLDGKTYPLHVFLADVVVSDQRDTLPWPRIATTPTEALGAIRFATGNWRIIGSLSEEQAAKPLDDAHFKQAVEKSIGPGDFTLIWQSIFTIHRRHAKTFRVRRALLAGDAGHINSPAGGQGMNAGIQDAHNLAWKLAYALRGGDQEALLSSYDMERHFAITDGVEKLTERVTKFGLSPGGRFRGLLFSFIKSAMNVPAVQIRALRAMSMLDTRYRRSPIFRGKSSLLGSRAPDPTLLTRYAPTIVLHDVGEEVTGAAWQLDIAGLQVSNRTDWTHWKCRAPFAALVRPDGVVGYFERNPTPQSLQSGVCAALGLS